ncbi:Ig-like domain-containing protein [Fulvivirga lutea]|uniref:Ig-like domain-containing protein n=1 Tax=Fulvivirga lutea TaxID=2810512 RepID=A0A974WJ69_9BACT|nr:Ig-like domain-containing protein [Fulvivirga lutea]QSE98753.1 Ig-like domain-containing protein [Fulvivirga lutea]
MKWLISSYKTYLSLLTAITILTYSSCKDDDDPTVAGPSVPVLTAPVNEAVDQSLTPTLSWQASESVAGIKEYAVFFGTSEDPTDLLATVTTTEVTLSTALAFTTKYYWKVQVKDLNDQIATSEIFSFTTKADTGFEIPDVEFGKALEAQGYATANGDTYVLNETAAATVKNLDLGGSSSAPLDIKNIDGIQFFTSLVELDIDYTSISDLDLSDNPTLDTLQYTNSSDNQANFLTNLVLPSGMKRIRIFRHNLAEFDATQFAELTYLRLDGDDIPNAEVDGVTNVLTTLTVDETINTVLVHLDMGGNLDADGEPITYEVSQALFAQLTSDGTGNKDGVVGAFEGEAGYELPDAEFGKALMAQGLATEDGGSYFLDEDAAATITFLDLGGSSGTPLNIQDIDGIQFFTSLVNLDIDYTSISDLDLSAVTTLDTLQYTNSSDNQANFLTNLTLPAGMKRIRIFRHNLSDFDATDFPELTYLRLDGDGIANAEVGGVTNVLSTLTVDESINTALVHLDMGGNLDGSGDPITYEVSQALFDQLTSDATGNKDGVAAAAPPETFSVVSVNPADATADVATSTQIIITFSSDINEASLVYTLKEGSTDVPHTSDVTGAVLTLTPNTNLSNSAVHTLEITSAEGTNGAGIENTFSSTFTTIAPGAVAVVSVEISSDLLTTGVTATEIDRAGEIIVTFDTSVETRFDENSYTLTSGGSTVGSSFVATGSMVTITPDANFDGETDYTLTLLSANPIADNDGSLPSDLVYDFTTAFYIGEGTGGSPYEISTAEELDEVRNNLSASFILMSDVNLSGFNAGFWDPIMLFTGSFNGNGNEISNLQIDLNTTDMVGLFGSTQGAEISDLGVSLGSGGVVGQEMVGSLIGSMDGGTVIDCYATGSGTVSSINAAGAAGIGGLIGEVVSSATITRSYSTVDVNGGADGDRVGGLIGYTTDDADAIIITECFASGNVTGIDDVGGLIGQATDGTISDCYAIGNVTGSNEVGGLIGDMKSAATNDVSNCYSGGTITSAGEGGFILGEASTGPSFSNLYYDNSLSHSIVADGNDGTPVGIDFGTDGDNAASFTGFSGSVWSFGTSGISGSNGPVLQWEL